MLHVCAAVPYASTTEPEPVACVVQEGERVAGIAPTLSFTGGRGREQAGCVLSEGTCNRC